MGHVTKPETKKNPIKTIFGKCLQYMQCFITMHVFISNFRFVSIFKMSIHTYSHVTVQMHKQYLKIY